MPLLAPPPPSGVPLRPPAPHLGLHRNGRQCGKRHARGQARHQREAGAPRGGRGAERCGRRCRHWARARGWWREWRRRRAGRQRWGARRRGPEARCAGRGACACLGRAFTASAATTPRAALPPHRHAPAVPAAGRGCCAARSADERHPAAEGCVPECLADHDHMMPQLHHPTKPATLFPWLCFATAPSCRMPEHRKVPRASQASGQQADTFRHEVAFGVVASLLAVLQSVTQAKVFHGFAVACREALQGWLPLGCRGAAASQCGSQVQVTPGLGHSSRCLITARGRGRGGLRRRRRLPGTRRRPLSLLLLPVLRRAQFARHLAVRVHVGRVVVAFARRGPSGAVLVAVCAALPLGNLNVWGGGGGTEEAAKPAAGQRWCSHGVESSGGAGLARGVQLHSTTRGLPRPVLPCNGGGLDIGGRSLVAHGTGCSWRCSPAPVWKPLTWIHCEGREGAAGGVLAYTPRTVACATASCSQGGACGCQPLPSVAPPHLGRGPLLLCVGGVNKGHTQCGRAPRVHQRCACRHNRRSRHQASRHAWCSAPQARPARSPP